MLGGMGWTILFLVLVASGCERAIPSQPSANDAVTVMASVRFPDDAQNRRSKDAPRYLFIAGERVTGRAEIRYARGRLSVAGRDIRPMAPSELDTVGKAARAVAHRSQRLQLYSEVPMVKRLVREGVSADDAIMEWQAKRDSAIGRVFRWAADSAHVGESTDVSRLRAILDPEIFEVDLDGPRALHADSHSHSVRLQTRGVRWPDLLMLPCEEYPDRPVPTAADTFAVARKLTETILEHVRQPGPLLVLMSSTGSVYLHGDQALEAIAQVEPAAGIETGPWSRGRGKRLPLGRFVDEIAYAHRER